MGMHNPMEGLSHWEAESTHGPEFAEKYGWKDTEDLRDNEREFFGEMWRVAFAHGRSQGQVDGVAYKSERTSELARENTDFKDQISDLQSELTGSQATVGHLQKQVDDKSAEASRLEGKVYELQGQLRESASGLRIQREQIEDLEAKVLALVNRNMDRISYRVWHKVMKVADERMSKAHA